ELRILARVDVVGDHRHVDLRPESPAQHVYQRCLAAADRSRHSDSKCSAHISSPRRRHLYCRAEPSELLMYRKLGGGSGVFACLSYGRIRAGESACPTKTEYSSYFPGPPQNNQNRKYRCAIGNTLAGSQVSSSPSARTSYVSGSTSICGMA